MLIYLATSPTVLPEVIQKQNSVFLSFKLFELELKKLYEAVTVFNVGFVLLHVRNFIRQGTWVLVCCNKVSAYVLVRAKTYHEIKYVCASFIILDI